MGTELRFEDIAALPAGADVSMVVVGRKALLLSDAVRQRLPEAAHAMWSVMLDKLTGGDAGQAATTWIPADGGARRVVACVLPEPCSRHNSRARPHAITTLLREHTPDAGVVSVLLALEQAEDAFAAGCAVARAYSHYNKKTSEAAKSAREVVVGLLPAEGSVGANDRTSVAHAATSVRLAAEWVDMPTCELHTDAFVEKATSLAAELGVASKVIRGEDLLQGGFGGLWNVGRAATRGPALVVLTHAPAGAKKSVVWVGKGLVYDTGGLSLKGSEHMTGMKGDMGGAAAVLGAFVGAVRNGFPHTLHAVLCLAENAIGPEAVRPDDVITLLSGKTVEINNTDAEGRLVLGDGVAYAVANLAPDIVVDLATLTGAQLVATGKRHAAVVCNDDHWEAAAVRAGRESGDLVHPLPYCPEFFRAEFKSDVADMKNSVKDRMNAQSSCAAQFVAEHLGDYKGPWLHVDIAGPSGVGERGTGFGVALLMQLFSRQQWPSA